MGQKGLPIASGQDSENISASDNFSDHFQLQIPQLFIAQPPGCRLCHGHDLLPLHLSATFNVYLCSAAQLHVVLCKLANSLSVID